MALFKISRYLGEDEVEDKLTRQEKILQKLQSEAVKRKQLRENRISDGNDKAVHDNEDDEDASPAKCFATPVKSPDVKQSRGEEDGKLVNNVQSEKSLKRKKAVRQEADQPIISSHDASMNDVTGPEETGVGAEEKGVGAETNKLENDTAALDDDNHAMDTEGFTIIRSIKDTQKQKTIRVLPDWLSHPETMQANIEAGKVPVNDLTVLDDSLRAKLAHNGITHLFPVQAQLIPALLSAASHTGASGGVSLSGDVGYRPRDICCSAPTGSGKTLAFVLPIVQALKSRVVRHVRAVVMLPVRDLAAQVYKVFLTYCQDTPLKVGLITGQKPFASEQKSLVKFGLRGAQSMVDIIVATPGRLVDHINKTDSFSLKHLRYLVIDEADRMMDEIKQGWLEQLERAVYGDNETSHDRHLPGPLTAARSEQFGIVLQKLLFSATLSQNPEKLQQIKLFQPLLYTAVSQSGDAESAAGHTDTTAAVNCEGNKKLEHFVGKYTTPAGLKELYMECSTEDKPLRLLHLLRERGFKKVLCFTNSLQATHRLYHLLQLVGGCEVRELSSGLHAVRRKKILKRFEAGNVDIIVCSDAMARGMDVSNVDFVVSYDLPKHFKTYIHRIGRTARAGRQGTALALLTRGEIFQYKKMLREAGKTGFKEVKVTKSQLKQLLPDYTKALSQLQEVLKEEKRADKQLPKKTKKVKDEAMENSALVD